MEDGAKRNTGSPGYVITTAVRDERRAPFSVRFYGPGQERKAEEYAAGLGGKFTIFKSRRTITPGGPPGWLGALGGDEEPVEGWPFLPELGLGIYREGGE